MTIMLNKIALGTAQFGLKYGISNRNGQTTKKEAHSILEYCKNSGIRYLDTAAAYGNSEAILGELLLENFEEEDFEITTKFKFLEGEDLYTLTNQSLKRLRRSSIDGQLFHSYLDYKKFLGHSKPHKVKNWGVSVYTNEEIIEVIKNPQVKMIQCPFNLLDNDSKRGKLLRKAKSKGIEVQVRSVFFQGLFFMNNDDLPKALTPLSQYVQKIHQICVINNLTIQELALGYCFSKEYIDKVVIGVESLDQLKSNIDSLTKHIPEAVYTLIDNIMVKNSRLLNPSNW